MLGDRLDVLDVLLERGDLRLHVRDGLLGGVELLLEGVDSGGKPPRLLDGVVVLPCQNVDVVLGLRRKARSGPVLPADERQEKREED